jgi:two-component system cell cycle response regulator
MISSHATAAKRPFTVLLVDDDSAILRLVSLTLRREGYAVIECASAAELQALERSQPWDLAILDRRLPDADGALLCQQIKADPALQNRYVMILTAESAFRAKLEGFELGADDYITKPFDIRELVARVRVGQRIVELQQRLMESNQRLELLSRTDSLTSVANRRSFLEEFDRAFKHSLRYERPISLTLIDLDFFKDINDRHGHLGGDEVLRHVSFLFSQSVRGSDTIARIGGEEFAVVLPETHLLEAVRFADKIRKLVEANPASLDHQVVPVTVSAGVCSLPHTQFSSTREMLRAADNALYRAKMSGRNRVEAERQRELRGTTRTRAVA